MSRSHCSVYLAGNALREDFTFRHTFNSEVSKLLKASPGQIVIVQPEKFRSKYEPASHTLSVKVILVSFLTFFTFLFAVELSKTSALLKHLIWTVDTCMFVDTRDTKF